MKTNLMDNENSPKEMDESLSNINTFGVEDDVVMGNTYSKNSLAELAELLENAVEKEDYREAAKIRDEISKR
jgi:protein-arginine kinase activator protein McsA